MKLYEGQVITIYDDQVYGQWVDALGRHSHTLAGGDYAVKRAPSGGVRLFKVGGMMVGDFFETTDYHVFAVVETVPEFRDDYAYMSNFWHAPFEWDGREWPTVENCYQARKTEDQEEREFIRVLTPGQAKRAGRKVKFRSDWEQVKYAVMMDAVSRKFAAHEDLAGMLLMTGNRVLIEGNNWHDCTWGVCRCDECLRKAGTNWLGEILMKVRHGMRCKREAVV